MCSALAESDDLTAEAKIRLAALELFGRSGHASVTVRAVAEAAGVSAPLVMHHFGSKAGLIAAVDDHVMERVAVHLDAMTSAGDAEGAKSALTAMATEPLLFDYLGRALASDGTVGDVLFDRLFQVSLDLIDRMVGLGYARAIEDREALAALLLVNDLGLILLRRHVVRAMKLDPLSREGLDRLAAVDLDLKTNPLLTYPEGEPS